MVVHGEGGIVTNPKGNHVLFVKVVSTPASENEVRFIYPVAFLNFRILEFWGCAQIFSVVSFAFVADWGRGSSGML
jgi:hypothetical protein